MLWQRVLTALILIPLVAWVVLYAPTLWFAVFFALITGVAAWEWTKLSRVHSNLMLVPFYLFLSVALSLLVFGHMPYVGIGLFPWVGFWLVMSALIFAVPERLMRQPVNGVPLLWLGAVLLMGASISLIQLRASLPMGPQLVMYLLLLIWIADSAAYFTGRAWGRHKLAVLISPKKSMEGAVGGMVACAVFAVAAGLYFKFQGSSLTGFVVLSIVVALISVIGDLFESLIKRKVGVKDSGHILPGHGGVLDRIDSLIAATPCFAFGLLLLDIAP